MLQCSTPYQLLHACESSLECLEQLYGHGPDRGRLLTLHSGTLAVWQKATHSALVMKVLCCDVVRSTWGRSHPHFFLRSDYVG